MTTMTASLILSMVDHVTGPARAAARSVDGLRAAAARNAQQMQAVQGQLLGAVGAAVALAAAVRAPIKAAMEFEAQMASVSTLVDTSTESISDMGGEVLEIGKRTPVAIADLTSALYDVRSAGIAAGEAMGVLEGSARLAVAGLGTTKQATDLVTSSINAFNIPAEEQARLYDVIFKAVKNGKTTIAELSQGFGAVAGTVANAGIEIDEYFASVAALTTAGLPAAQAHTQIRAAIAGLTRETKQSSKIFRALGVKTFAELVEKSGGMVNAFSLIREQVGGNDAEMIKLLGSVEAYNAVLGLSGSVNGKYAETLDDMRNGANAVDEAFSKQSETTRRTIQMFMNSMVQLAVSIGESLLPALRAALDVIGPITSAIAQWAQANPELISSIFGLVAGLVSLRLVTLSARWAFLFLKGGVLDAAIASARGASGMLGLVSILGTGSTVTRGAALQAAALARAQVEATAKGYAMARSSLSLARAGKLAGTNAKQAAEGLRAAGQAASAAQQNLLKANMALSTLGKGGAVSGLLATLGPVGAAVAAVSAPMWLMAGAAVAVGLAIYNYWTPISEFVTGFASVVGSALGEAVSAIAGAGGRIASAVAGWAAERIVDIGEMLGFDRTTIRSAIDNAAASISAGGTSIIAAVKAIPSAVAGWVRDIFTINRYSEQAAGEFRSAGERVGQALVDGIKAAFDALWEWLKTLPSKIIAAIGRIDLSGLISWPSLPRWMGGGAPSPANDNAAIAGTRAAGGAIAGGRTYLVGENGPELVTPSRSGYVHDAETTAAMSAGGQGVAAGPVSQSVHMGGVTIQVIAQPGMDPQAIAHAVNEALGQIAGDALSGGQFDQEWSVA